MPIKATVKAVTAATGLTACNAEVVATKATTAKMDAKTTIVPTAKVLWLTSSSTCLHYRIEPI
jgi:hypothetical protein